MESLTFSLIYKFRILFWIQFNSSKIKLQTIIKKLNLMLLIYKIKCFKIHFSIDKVNMDQRSLRRPP